MSQNINFDAIPKDDLLNRKQFAKEIASGLSTSLGNGENSFVLGINGKWGSGKTTLMHYLKDELKNQTHEKIERIYFDFNPWMFSGQDVLVTAFLEEFGKALSLPNLKKKIAALGKVIKRLDWIKYVSSKVGELQQEVEKIFEGFDKEPTIRELMEGIDEELVKSNTRVFVFIDDLDRLTPTEIIEVFQIVKLNANFKNTVFVIAFDKEVVQEVLLHHYGFNGERYLEKIVQVDYRVPDPMDEVIQKIFFDNLRSCLDGINVKYDDGKFSALWIIWRLKYYFITLRDVHRYFNALKLRLPSVKNDIDITQFCVIEAIRIFDYNSYELIQKNYRKGVMFGPNTSSSSAHEDIKNENTTYLYKYLFSQKESLESEYPISEPQFFERYFALSLRTTDAYKDTLNLFCKEASSRTHILERAQADGSIKNVLARLKGCELDLLAISPLIRWRAETEPAFVNCIREFIDLLYFIMHREKDFSNSMKYLASILPGDDGHFNPAKFYLLIYFNDYIWSNAKLPFSSDIEVIKNYRKMLLDEEKDLLKRHDKDHMMFTRPYTKTDAFHRLFCSRFNIFHPEEYTTKISTYVNRPDNLVHVLKFFIDIDLGEERAVDLEWAKKVLNSKILTAVKAEASKVDSSGLPGSDRVVHDIFMKNIPQIRSAIQQKGAKRRSQ